MARQTGPFSRNPDYYDQVSQVDRVAWFRLLSEEWFDTVFADTQAAYEGLWAPIRQFVDGLSVLHDGRPAFGKLVEIVGQGEWDGEPYTSLDPGEHPVVRMHPETGRKNLFVNPGFTSRIVGLSRKESDALLGFLYEHMTRQEFLVRYSWGLGLLGQPDDDALRGVGLRRCPSSHPAGDPPGVRALLGAIRGGFRRDGGVVTQ